MHIQILIQIKKIILEYIKKKMNLTKIKNNKYNIKKAKTI